MRRSRDSGSGFLLLEALVALALVGVALLLTLGLFASEARFRRVATARTAALGTAEDLLELVRSRTVPFRDATIEHRELEVLLDRPLPPMTAWIELADSATPGLRNVTVTVRWVAGGVVRQERLPSRVRGP